MMMAVGILLMLVPAGSSAADDAIVCDNAMTQFEMNRCALLDYQAADKALNEQWDLAAAQMKALDAEIDREYDNQPGHFETLLESQRAWLKFRDAQCLFESFMARGGSMQPMLDSHCKAYMTNLRTQQLRDLVATP